MSRLQHPSVCAGLLAAGLCAFGTASAAGTDAQASLGAWKDYALRSMTPDYQWANRPAEAAVTPSAFDAAVNAPRSGTMPHLDFVALDAKSGLGVSIGRSRVGDTPAFENGGVAFGDVTHVGTGIERTYLSPSVTRELTDRTSVTASAIFVYQQFASWGLGSSLASDSTASGPMLNGATESSAGSGVRIEMHQQLGPVLGFNVAYQSKVDMDAFQNYRGVYSDPGDFDIPALASVGLGWQIAPRATLGFGVSRVM